MKKSKNLNRLIHLVIKTSIFKDDMGGYWINNRPLCRLTEPQKQLLDDVLEDRIKIKLKAKVKPNEV